MMTIPDIEAALAKQADEAAAKGWRIESAYVGFEVWWTAISPVWTHPDWDSATIWKVELDDIQLIFDPAIPPAAIIPKLTRKAKGAFTLLELLACIAIIATMLGLLLFRMSAVRETGRIAVCQSNLHTLGTAIHVFINDHGQLPYGTYFVSIPDGQHELMVQLDDYIDGPDPKTLSSEGDEGFLLLRPWVCPSDTLVAVEHGCSYVYVPGIAFGIVGYSPVTLIEFETFPYRRLMEDADSWHASGTGLNRLRNDGSVQMVRMTESAESAQ